MRTSDEQVHSSRGRAGGMFHDIVPEPRSSSAVRLNALPPEWWRVAVGDLVAHRPLSGLSDAHVFVATRDHRTWFVRKIARDAAGSARLRRQADKQIAFQNLAGDLIRTPRILDACEADGLFYFDMEWIRAVDGATYLGRAHSAQVESFAERLCAYFEFAACNGPILAGSGEFVATIRNKIVEAQTRTSKISPKIFQRILCEVENLEGLSVNPTLCHGDFTLENMMVDARGAVWAFDFLDCPFEHYWHDVAKIHQDLAGGWYARYGASISHYVLEYVSRRLRDTVDRISAQYARLHDIFLSLVFIRALPYAQDQYQEQYIRDRIDHFVGALHASQRVRQ